MQIFKGINRKKRCKTGNSNIVFLWKYTQYLILSFQQLLLETLSILGSEIYGRLTLCSNTIWTAFSKQGGGAVGRREKLQYHLIKHLYIKLKNSFAILTLHLLYQSTFFLKEKHCISKKKKKKKIQQPQILSPPNAAMCEQFIPFHRLPVACRPLSSWETPEEYATSSLKSGWMRSQLL